MQRVQWLQWYVSGREIIHAMFFLQATEALEGPQQSKLKDTGQRTTGEERF